MQKSHFDHLTSSRLFRSSLTILAVGVISTMAGCGGGGEEEEAQQHQHLQDWPDHGLAQ